LFSLFVFEAILEFWPLSCCAALSPSPCCSLCQAIRITAISLDASSTMVDTVLYVSSS
jgi:hypothetical protein